MDEVLQFLADAKTFYIATVDGDQPRVRPFGVATIFEGKLYIVTGKVKPVSKQMAKNPKIEICAMRGGEWIRIEAKAIDDDRIEAREDVLKKAPGLARLYKADDGNMQVLYLKDVTATISSYTDAPKVIKF